MQYLNYGQKIFLIGICCCLGLVSISDAQQQAFLLDGKYWQELDYEARITYIKGVGNMADFSLRAGGSGRDSCIARAFVEDLKNKTVADIVQEVDQYYQTHPESLSTSVIEVILRESAKVCPPEGKQEEKR
ncbi:MAG: hypothetical protein PHW74_01895 [Desulfobacca sp.]|nr:hypothetical protein [Desulfobacca sp.]